MKSIISEEQARATKRIKSEPITLWYRDVQIDPAKPPRFEFNHYEHGHVEALAPTPVSEEQRRAWRNAQWQYRHAYLVAGSSFPRVSESDAAAADLR